ncbi:MAG: hypothetical protein WBX15_06105 [Thermoanaerobaculia bacterium]
MRKSATAILAAFIFISVAAIPARAEIIDRIAAVVEQEVITLSEVNQIINLRVIPKNADEDEATYHRRVLDAMIAQLLRFRDVERFGAQDVSKDAIEARLQQVIQRFPSQAAFEETLSKMELSLDELKAILKRQLQVEAYIEERFSPTIFVSLDEIERYYTDTWVPMRKRQGLPVQPLGDVREAIRDLLKQQRLQQEVDRWTKQLRSHANVDVFVYR